MPDDDGFDALGAAAELDAVLRGEGVTLQGLESELVVLRARLADTETALRAADARADRAEEEISRARERLARDARLEIARGKQGVLLDLIELLDDLDRALEAGDGSPLQRGIELVRRRFLAVLASHGVTPIVALGELFDPAIHDAVSMLPAVIAAQAGRVIAVVRAGYRMGDAPLRPAGVVVAKGT